MDWTTPNESRMKAEFAGYAGGVLILKKRRSVLLASLPQPRIGQKRINGLKLNREDYGVDKYFLLLEKSKDCRKTIKTVAFT